MEQSQIRDAAELVSAALSPAPSAAFSLFRIDHEGNRYEFPVRVKVLRASEMQDVLQAAQKTAKKREEDPAQHKDIYNEEQAVQLIAKSLVHTEKGKREDGTEFWRPLFVNADHLRSAFTEIEIAYCLNLYELTKAKFSILRDFDPNDLDSVAAQLADTLLGPYFLAQLDSTQWPKLLLCLAQRVCDLSASQSQEQTDSPDSSESRSENSDSGITGSTGSPSASLSGSNVQIPDGHLLSSQEARELHRKIEQEAAPKKPSDD